MDLRQIFPFPATDFQLQIESVFNPWLSESSNVKPVDNYEKKIYLLKKNLPISEPIIQTHVVQGSGVKG